MNTALLGALADHVQSVAGRDRTVVDIGPFRAFFSDTSDDPLLSLAVPRQPAPDWRPGIEALQAAFAARNRTLRLEYFSELFPTLAMALAAEGLDSQDTMPVLVLAAGEPIRVRATAGLVLSCPGPDDGATLRGLMALQARCFQALAGTNGDSGWLAQMRTDLASGLASACVASVAGEIIGGAMLISGGGAAELVGVATDPAWRRRRIASATCARLIAESFAGGNRLVWLSAGSPPAHALYKRLGFRHIGTQLNAGPPPSADGGGVATRG
ncbi:MAG: GNAT family N-acetyltransferase [Alphaproteobacteria bacterium]|jgi:ribosomal protein S18 acetylase RimI-like enzyme|nr:GNAT family N-acetyltransferase [Alphaproteobacteria bacterium]